MILQSEGKEHDPGLDASLLQLTLEYFTPAPTVSWSVANAMREEEEEVAVLAEELDNYFLCPSANWKSSPISKHMDIMHKHFNGSFPMDPTVFAQLQKSLLRIAKSVDPSIAPGIKEAC